MKASVSPGTKKRQKLPVGNKIREIRKAHGLTQAELAGRIGIQQSDLCRMEKGEYKVSLETLFKVLGIFGLAIGDFFADQDPFAVDGSAELVAIYRTLSAEEQKELLEFARFKNDKRSQDTPDH
jgi:transcriptional regulator with XRE-family HTH domain